MKKNSCWVNYKWVTYQESNSHIRDKVKVVLELSNCDKKKLLSDATGDTSNIASWKILLFWSLKLIN